MWFVYAVVAASAVLSLVQLKIRKRQDFRGKHVFITGGSEGIGLGLAREFLQRGCRVTLVARTRSKLESARARLVEEDASAANRVGIAAADVTEESQVMEAVRSATQAYGPIDVLMCNAGIVEPGYFLDLETDQFDSVMRVNYGGTLRTIKAVLPGMLARRSGYISLTCSPLSAIGMTGYSAYSPSKAAIRSLADSLRVELTSTGVGISVSYPPDTSTPGFVREHQLMVPETASYYKLIGNSVFPCQQVCACMVKGMEAGKYHLPAPDVLQNLLLTCTCGPTPRSFLLPVEMLLGLLAPLIAAPMIWLQERCVVWHGQERLQRQAQLASE